MNTFEDIEITLTDGTVEHHQLDQKKMILGRGPSADIVVASGELAAQHLLLVPKMKGCWVSVSQNATTPVTINGQSFNTGLLRWGTKLCIGSLKITLGRESQSKEKKSKIHPAIVAAACFLIALLALMHWARPDEVVHKDATMKAPALFKSFNTCNMTGEKTFERISALSIEAESKAQRYIFDPSDGVQAIILFQNAENCLKEIRVHEAATVIHRRRIALEQMLTEDYASSRARLEAHLRNEEHLEALREVLRLKQLLNRQSNEYTDWLERLERSLHLKLAE